VYEGTRLSVRALTAEKLDRFLQAHAGQPAQLLGSGWDALQPPSRPPGHSVGFPRAPRPGRARLAGAPARRAAAGAARRVRQPRLLRPACLPAAVRRRAGRLGPHGRLARRHHRRRRHDRRHPAAGGRAGPAGGYGSASPAIPAPGATAPAGSGPPPACSAAWVATATWSSMTWRSPAPPPTLIIL
jgi:hypothetical protein